MKKNGWNLLHQAAADGDLKIVRRLMEDDHFDIREKTIDNLTAPQLAAINGHEEVVRWFLSTGKIVTVHGYKVKPRITRIVFW